LGVGDVLAREASADDIDGLGSYATRRADGTDIFIPHHIGPMPRKHAATPFIDLDLPHHRT
jgi:hypothetical protein